MLPGDAVFRQPNHINTGAISYFHNDSFSLLIMHPKGAPKLLANDGGGVRMLAVNWAENVVAANLFPGTSPDNNGEFYELLENAIERAATNEGMCVDAKFTAKCKKGGKKVKLKLKKAAANRHVTLRLDNIYARFRSTNNRGKAKYTYKDMAPGPHTATVCTLSKGCTP